MKKKNLPLAPYTFLFVGLNSFLQKSLIKSLHFSKIELKIKDQAAKEKNHFFGKTRKSSFNYSRNKVDPSFVFGAKSFKFTFVGFFWKLEVEKMGQVAPDEISFFNLKAIQWQKAPRPNTLIYVECCENSTLGP